MPTELLDHGGEYEHQLLSGTLILTWRQLGPKSPEFPTELEFTRDESASSAAKELSYTVQISNWTVYPRIEGVYIVASCVKTKFKLLARWYPATVSARMAWRFTEVPRNNSQDSLTHWLISHRRPL